LLLKKWKQLKEASHPIGITLILPASLASQDTESLQSRPTVCWQENDQAHEARWQSSHSWPAPDRLLAADDRLTADKALKLLNEGTSIVWRGDFFNGKQLLDALKRRLQKRKALPDDLPYPERFHRVRLIRAQQARALGRLLIPLAPDYTLAHRRAPSVAAALSATYGPCPGPLLVPLTELLGVLSAYQWQVKGLWLDALQARLYPQHGVFAPTRHEYLDLVIQAELPNPCHRALDVGTGTGVLAALLAKRGISEVVATDMNPSALSCARNNLAMMALSDCVQVEQADLFVRGQFDLVVCNPPWIPGRASGPLEAAVYDPESRMLKQFLAGVARHLRPKGQAWLILSDLAEHLGLRSRATLLDLFAAGGLEVTDRLDISPRHGKRLDDTDPLADVRRKEITSLWRLSLAGTP
jgi:methylase of polypeptide subunit release factors